MSDSINSVKVLSIDEERLKYRVILGHTGGGAGGNPNRNKTRGGFTVNLPPPTSLTNSNEYYNAVIKVDSFTAEPGQLIANPTWAFAGGVIKIPGVEIVINVPTSQVLSIDSDVAVDIGIGTVVNQRFAQLLPVQIVNVGDTNGLAPAAGGYAVTAIGSGIASTDPLLVGNPFGKDITIDFKTPVIERGSNVWLAAGAAPAVDIGYYALQLTIELVPNK